MTIKKLIDILQSHGDDGTADVCLSYNADFGSGDQEYVVDIASIRLEMSPEGTVQRIVLVVP